MLAAAERLATLGPANVLLKGGHLAGGESPDLLLATGRAIWLDGSRIDTRHTHGTGCTLSSAIAALLARGLPLADAVAEAKRWLSAAIAAGAGLGVGGGIGPVHHFHAVWPLLAAADG
jgi:hydroxymethylpyrimidine/phosphomethylpyrimidine kinase